MRKFEYISDITEQEVETNNVISCINEDGMPCILIKNAVNKTVKSAYTTDNLDVKFNSVLRLHDEDYYFHIITAKNNDLRLNKQFEVIFDYVFRKISEPIDEDGLNKLFGSIEELFRISPDADVRNLQVGVFGELLVVKQLYEHGYIKIVDKYHTNFYSKHDIEISETVRIEVKTSVSEKRMHRFKHSQLHRDDIQLFVASSLLEEAQEGLSLYSLFEETIGRTIDPEKVLSLYKLMAKCGVSEEDEGIRCSEQKALDELRYYDGKILPQLDEIPEGISSVSYDVDCAFAPCIVVDDFIKLLDIKD